MAFEAFYAEPSRKGVYKSAEFRGEGVPMVNMRELFGHDFIGSQDMDRVQLSDAELGRSMLQEGDLLFGRRSLVEAGAGKCSLVLETREPITFESSILRVRLRRDVANPRFFHYYFASPEGRGRIRTIVYGAAVKGIRGNDLAKLQVAVPQLDVQNRIADVLRPYDDLVENNRRRMALLEEAAQQLYREWFVRLRFPAHEHNRVDNGVPDGWERTTAYAAMDILRGGTPKTNVAEYWDGDIPFYTPKDAIHHSYVLRTQRSITEIGLKNCNSPLYPVDTVFISARGRVGKLNLASCPMAISQSCYALVGKRHVEQLFLFCALKDRIEHFKQHAVGALFDAIVVDTFRRIPFIVPDERNVRFFEQTVTPMFRQIRNLAQQNRRLYAARDLLLRRLMSRDITV